ncbi:MAG: zf-HC2 domain-containing protein [Ignavibacteriaceae bacterium]|jgi:predicted anti-sigma-YlaC factor YlaD
MKCDEIKLMISEYLDDELSKEKEIMLFMHISGCPDCREEFKHQNLIQHTVKLHQHEVSDRLEQKIFNSIKDEKKSSVYKLINSPVPVYINFILGLVIVIIALFSFLQLTSLRNDLNDINAKYNTALEGIQYQSQQIDLMMSNMPAVKITGQPVKIIN